MNKRFDKMDNEPYYLIVGITDDGKMSYRVREGEGVWFSEWTYHQHEAIHYATLDYARRVKDSLDTDEHVEGESFSGFYILKVTPKFEIVED